MTFNEAIKHAEEVAEEKEKEGKLLCNSEVGSTGCLKCAEEHRQLAEWLKDYKRLLEQEPCDYAISRQSAIFLADDLKQDLPDDGRIAEIVMAHNEGILEYQTQLSLLPPVNPQPKTGNWILDADREHGCCSECGCKEDLVDGHSSYKWCSNCGAKMEVSE